MNEKLNSSPLHEEERLFAQFKAPLSVSKEVVWEELSKQIEKETPRRMRVRHLSPLRMLVAACIALLGCFSFVRWYTFELNVPPGRTEIAILPDGSSVHLNAGTHLSYHPYWWFLKREVALEGEAFFQVEEGSQCQVHSEKGVTSVLGTSFNIYASNLVYEVFCETGKVEVTNSSNGAISVLLPGDFVTLKQSNLERRTAKRKEILDWTESRFYAREKPLPVVLEELERIYGISVQAEDTLVTNKYYNGNFQLPDDPQKVLELVCAAFGASYTQLSPKTYALTFASN